MITTTTARAAGAAHPHRGAAVSTRQQLLVLCLGNSDLGAPVASWTFYDGSTPEATALEDIPNTPPYANGLEAIRDGWRLIRWPRLEPHNNDTPYELSYFPHEFVFEKLLGDAPC